MLYSRIDLHVHSAHSKNADNTLLKAIGVNECYTQPQQVYKRALARGMDWVTISDHDTITGALEIAHLPNTFISEEITTYFPEDHGKIHVVALHINKMQHDEIQRLRGNVYELVDYLNQQQIIHFLAHPFFGMSTIITMQHIEKMLLLFKNIEVKNGGKQLFKDNLLETILSRLTRQQMMDFANKHNIAPNGDSPWIKNQVAGSDDHGGILIGCPHTVVPKATSPQDILQSIQNGESQAGGFGGTYQSVSHQIFSVVHGFAADRLKKTSLKTKISLAAGKTLFGGKPARRLTSIPTEWLLGLLSINEMEKLHFSQILRKQIKQDKNLADFIAGRTSFDHENNQKFMDSISTIVNQTLTDTFSDQFANVAIAKKIKTVLSAAPLLLPYFISVKTEYGDRTLMAKACDAF